jgi:hypothetical protein
MIEEGVCEGCALLATALPVGPALSDEALFLVRDGVLALSYVALSSGK